MIFLALTAFLIYASHFQVKAPMNADSFNYLRGGILIKAFQSFTGYGFADFVLYFI
jgi:hypothetical protein